MHHELLAMKAKQANCETATEAAFFQELIASKTLVWSPHLQDQLTEMGGRYGSAGVSPDAGYLGFTWPANNCGKHSVAPTHPEIAKGIWIQNMYATRLQST